MRLIFAALIFATGFYAGVANADHPVGASMYCSDEADAQRLMELLVAGEGEEAGRLVRTDRSFKCYSQPSGVGPMVNMELYAEFKSEAVGGHSCVMQGIYDGEDRYKGMDVWMFARQADCWRVLHEKGA